MAIPHPAVSVPITYVDNRPFVTVRVNGHPLRFIVDTGADDTIDTAAARRLGLKVRAAGTTGGAGESTVSLGTTVVGTLQLGARAVKQAHLSVIDLSIVAKHLGLEPLDGTIGYNFFENDVISFVNSKSRLLIGDVPVGGIRIPFSLYGTIPKITARIDGFSGEFAVDTGDRSNATLFAGFAASHASIKSAVRRSGVVTGWGLGGPIRSDLVELDSVALGSLSVESLVGRIALAKHGAFADTTIAGTIGNGVLRRFDVSFDYRRRTMFLEQNDRWAGPVCPPLPLASAVILPQECLIGTTR